MKKLTRDRVVPIISDGGRCPACNSPASIAPASSEYRGGGIIHHHWQRRACGHEWITVLNVPV